VLVINLPFGDGLLVVHNNGIAATTEQVRSLEEPHRPDHLWNLTDLIMRVSRPARQFTNFHEWGLLMTIVTEQINFILIHLPDRLSTTSN